MTAPSFTDPKQIEDAFNKYIARCENSYCVESGKYKEVPTMSGLAYELGVDRKTLVNYSKKEAYFPTIKKCKEYVESKLEQMLLTDGNPAGKIFALKNNFNWEDKTKQESTVNHNISIIDNLNQRFKAVLPEKEVKELD